MVFALLFSRLMTVLLISSIFFILLSLILLRFLKDRNIKGKSTNKYFPVVLRVILILNIFTLMIPAGFKIADLTYKDESQIADEHLSRVIESIESHEKEDLRAMFSKQALDEAEDLDGRIEYLFGFIQGNIESWEREAGGMSGSSSHGHIVKKTRYWYTVTTDKEKYMFFLLEYPEDTDHPENVGLYMLQVIKAEDRDTQFDGGQDILCAGIYHPSIINNLKSAKVLTNQIANNDSLGKLTAEELNKLEFLRSDWTENQMLDNGFELKQNEEFDRVYSQGFVEYHYGNELGNGSTPDWVSIYGNINVEGPRGISIGDSFEDVFTKFPNEKNWKESESGEFYGEFEKNDNQPYLVGAVRESGDTKVISVYPKEGIPCLFVCFKNDVVVSYTIEMQFLNP